MPARAAGLPAASLLVEEYCHECAFIILHLLCRARNAGGGPFETKINWCYARGEVPITRPAVRSRAVRLRASAGATTFLKQRLPIPRIVCTGAMGTDELQGRR